MSTEQLQELGPIDYVVSGIELGDLKQMSAAFAEVEGASSGLLGYDDLQEAAAALRRSGGQLVASGRLPVQAILAALDEVEATN